jgi:ferredoxin
MSHETLKTISCSHGGCKGCMACVEIAPHVFGWDEDLDVPFLKVDRVPEDLARELVSYCPDDCIEMEDD